ncbi:MAG: hypothetical protein KDI59_06295 [Xanthomonadales bacterium]|nr:hypothetical protein [Xanthomonadales bacterium]
MSNKQIQISTPVQLQVALIPVCKMVIRFGMHFYEFVRNMQKAYIHAAEEILNESDIKPNHQAIAIKTGMDRRTIAEQKNNPESQNHNPLNKMDMVIVQLQLYFAKEDKSSISNVMLKSIIDSIYAGHIRSGAVIEELLSNKIIIKSDDNHYKLNLTLQQQLADIQMMADEVDYTAKRLFQTYYKNMFDDKHQYELGQQTVISTKIASSKQAKVLELLGKELEKSKKRMEKILKEHESNVPENTYPELGVTEFQFSSLE